MAVVLERESDLGIQSSNFLEAKIGPDVRNKLTSRTPWSYTTMEIFLEEFRVSGRGGLGVLGGDTVLQARDLGIPFIAITPLYSTVLTQNLDSDFYQLQSYKTHTPENEGYKFLLNVPVKTLDHDVNLSLYEVVDAPVMMLYEPGLGEIFSGSPSDDHRMYQSVMLGFGGKEAKKRLGLEPSVIHLQESATVFEAIALLDEKCSEGKSVEDAIDEIREVCLFTNHTLVPGAIAINTLSQFERFAFPNMKSEKSRDWLSGLIKSQGGSINLSLLALLFSGQRNGVSKLHSRIASTQFRQLDGSLASFSPITNGVYLKKWMNPEIYDYYHEQGVLDQFDLPTSDYDKRLMGLDSSRLRTFKDRARDDLVDYLGGRVDQYGRPPQIKNDAEPVFWAKRVDEYKRPGMITADLARVARLANEYNLHFIMSGVVHPENERMKRLLQGVLGEVDQSDLRDRFSYIQNYNSELAKYSVRGASVWCNTPRVGEEACGTSWEKPESAILISTKDGGPADIEDAPYLQIEGGNEGEERESLYQNLERAGQILRSSDEVWGDFIKKQNAAFLPTKSASRMWRDYINKALPIQP